MSSAALRLFPIPVGGTQKLLRYPILVIVLIIVTIELIIYCILRIGVKIYEYLREKCARRKRQLWRNLRDASNYNEYVGIATELDMVEKRNSWKSKDDSYCYDVTLVNDILDQMLNHLKSDNYEKLSSLLIEVFSHCLNWFETEALYNRTYHGTKNIVRLFIDTVIQSMQSIKDCDESKLSNQQKIELFTRLQQEFGRTALCLSGGGTLTFYQFGVIKAMLETNLMPKIVSGTSGGALVGSFIAVRTDDELIDLLKPEMHQILNANSEPLYVKLKRLWKTGYYFDWDDWKEKTRVATKGDTTFLEAYKRTGRIFNVTAISDNHRPVLLNYKTAPHIVIWSAVIASASLPMLMAPCPLIKKKKNGELTEFTSYGRLWCDGSIQFDVPTQRLLEDFNVKFNITVQCNPHINIFYYNSRGTASSPVNHWGHSGMRGGFLSSLLEKLLKLEMRKWMRLLSDMDLLPQVFGHDWRHMAIQQTRGQITMTPTPPFMNYLHLVNDPTLERMTEYLKTGQSIAYPYLGMIGTRLRLQNAIRKHISDLDQSKDHSLLQKLLDGTSEHSIIAEDRFHMIQELINNHIFVRSNSADNIFNAAHYSNKINSISDINNNNNNSNNNKENVSSIGNVDTRDAIKGNSDNINNSDFNNDKDESKSTSMSMSNDNNNSSIGKDRNDVNMNDISNYLNNFTNATNMDLNRDKSKFPHQTTVNLRKLAEKEQEMRENSFLPK